MTFGIPYAHVEVTPTGTVRTCPICGEKCVDPFSSYDEHGELVLSSAYQKHYYETHEPKVIRRRFHGGTEDVTFAEFCDYVVQDDRVAVEIAARMLDGDGTLAYTNNEESIYFETFEVIDREALSRELEKEEL